MVTCCTGAKLSVERKATGGWVGIFVNNASWASWPRLSWLLWSGKVVVAGEVGEVVTRTGRVAAPLRVCWMSPWLMKKESRQLGGEKGG